MYLRGTQFWLVIISSSMAALSGAELFLPVYYDLNLSSVNQYLKIRFNSEKVRLAGTFTFLFATVPYMGVSIYEICAGFGNYFPKLLRKVLKIELLNSRHCESMLYRISSHRNYSARIKPFVSIICHEWVTQNTRNISKYFFQLKSRSRLVQEFTLVPKLFYLKILDTWTFPNVSFFVRLFSMDLHLLWAQLHHWAHRCRFYWLASSARSILQL